MTSGQTITTVPYLKSRMVRWPVSATYDENQLQIINVIMNVNSSMELSEFHNKEVLSLFACPTALA